MLCYLVAPASQQCSIISARPAARTHLPTVSSPHTLSNSTVYGYRCSTTLNRLIRLPELLLPTKCYSYQVDVTRTNCFTLIHKGNTRNVYILYVYILYIYKVQAGRWKLILRGSKPPRRPYAVMTWTGTTLRYVTFR